MHRFDYRCIGIFANARDKLCAGAAFCAIYACAHVFALYLYIYARKTCAHALGVREIMRDFCESYGSRSESGDDC